MLKKILIGGGIAAVLILIVAVSLARRTTSGENVFAAEVSRGDVVTIVSGTGVVQPRTKVNISSEVYGQIVQIAVKEGQNVAKGDLLVRIDPEKYRTEADRLAANVRVNSIAIESQEVSLKNLLIDQKRARDLFAQGVQSRSEMEKADLAVDTAVIQLKSLKESVSQAEAALDRAKADLSKTTIFAPMAGKVTQVNSEAGEQVIVGTTNIPGSVIMVISDMSEVIAEVNVDETQVVRLRSGQKATVTADAVEKTTYNGRVEEIRNTAKKDGEVNVFGVKIILTDADERLRPGMTAKAKIEVDREHDVLRIPVQAVTSRERKVLDADRRAAGSRIRKDDAGRVAAGAGDASAAELPGAGDGGKESASSEKAGASSPRAETASARANASGANGSKPAGGAGPRSAAAGGGQASTAGSGESSPPSGSPGNEREELEVVYVIDHDVVHAVPIKTGPSDEVNVAVESGLDEKAVIVKGPYRILKRLKDGDRVIRQSESEAIKESEDTSK